MPALSFTVEFVIEECCACHMMFAVSKDFQRRKQVDHGSFHCPEGHTMSYTGKTELDRLRESTTAAQQALQAKLNEANHAKLVAEKERNQIAAEKKRMEARAAAGVCLCCNRTFEDLARHMESKHSGVLGPGKEQRQIEGERAMPVMVEELELGVRAYNCLKNAGIDTIQELLAAPCATLFQMKNFGKKSMDEINAELGRLGLPVKK